MDHSQEHIATLCAVGTVGIAAAGLALGTSDGDSHLLNPGKRKAPGAPAAPRTPVSLEIPSSGPPNTSQVTTSSPSMLDRRESRLSTSILRRRTTRKQTPSSATTDSSATESRESSLSRHGVLRPWTSDRESSTERSQTRPSSSWLRRMSSLSRPNNSGQDSSSPKMAESPATSLPSVNDMALPNKLVKRSSSKRLVSHGRDTPPLLKRPATSHQRSATFSGQPYNRPFTTESDPVAIPTRSPSGMSLWRPFFDSGYARKRHSASVQRELPPRTISMPQGRPPILLLGNSVEPRDDSEGPDERVFHEPGVYVPTSTRRHKLRRTLTSVRKGMTQRNFTDPIVRVNNQEAYGSIIPPTTAYSNTSPMSNLSAFEVDLPHGTPVFASSPPSYGVTRFTVPKRVSVAPSDPTTASSDNETRVFTDDDSMEFQSDTAFDSIATRATASSRSGTRQHKIETMFNELPGSDRLSQVGGIEDLLRRTTLNDEAIAARDSTIASGHVGIGINGLDNNIDDGEMHDISPDQISTPVKASAPDLDDLLTTPVPKRSQHLAHLGSSPPAMQNFPSHQVQEPVLPRMAAADGEMDINWSPKSDLEHGDGASNLPRQVLLRSNQSSEDDLDEQRSNKRSSIFDWSENQALGSDNSNGVSPRPRTVHGKQINNAGRSRPSGRKSNAAMHLRSQSVPVNRDNISDTDLPPSNSRFGTWGLGQKPVSEEWGDDFEFDDSDETDEPQEIMPDEINHRESIRSVKVPQSIIDRQASVHLQFGQVRDFMLLVEELKRLRTRGASLGLLQSHSRQLWDDAESIIDLATFNDEEETILRPPSPVLSDVFGEETPSKRAGEDSSRKLGDGPRSINRRSISSPATPPYVRPKGESAQTKTFLQTIHQHRTGLDSSPVEVETQPREKLPFDTQDLRDLVIRAGVISRALKEIVRQAEGVAVSPEKTPVKPQDPSFRQIFDPPEPPSSPTSKKPGLPKSRSENSYLDGMSSTKDHDMSPGLRISKVVEAN